MVTKIHLHATLPHDINRPNAALGYLKSYLSHEHCDVSNVYWYLQPKDVMDSISSLLSTLRGSSIHVSVQSSLLAAYLSRFFCPESSIQPTIAQSILTSYTPLQRIKKTASALKGFIDYTIETENMADVEIAGFTVKLYQWFINQYVWSQLKKLNPNVTIVAGGIDTAEEALAFMRAFKDIDCAVWGEGEIPLKELAERHGERSLSGVSQLVYRDRNGLHVTQAANTRIEMHPFADHTDYFERMKKFGLSFSPHIPIVSTRSCRWNRCKFCILNKGAVYYERPAEEVVREIEFQSKKFDNNHFSFSDSDIGRKKESDFDSLLGLLLESVIRRKRPYEIYAEITPARLTPQTVEKMSHIRLHVQIGFEALTDSLLENMNKMHRFSENIQALKLGNEYGLDISGLNILRNIPGECEEDILESLKNAQFLRFFLKRYRLVPSELVLYKGAPYYEETPLKEKEEKWIVNLIYNELERTGMIRKEDRWDFFGFAADGLKNHQYWEHILDFLEKMQSGDIEYSWSEFPDGSSLIEERNEVSGSKNYFLDETETRILKYCDTITPLQNLYDEFPNTDVDAIVSQFQQERILFVDGKKRLISVFSANEIRCVGV
ncbi:MAG: radical SAM protein [Theionarchaea archaeon]|nr:radical SAM protein [Theionarchaea archaeon]MBU7019535.1 radical SAM protein [Theionarchaea archaeon]